DVDLVVAAVGERDPALPSAGGLLEAQLEHRLLVTPAPREALEAAGPPAASPASRQPVEALCATAAAEQPFDQIGEVAVAELDAHVIAVEAAATSATAAEVLLEARGAADVFAGLPVRSQPVVLLALLRVAEDLVGLGDLLEAVLGARVLVDVGVVLA